MVNVSCNEGKPIFINICFEAHNRGQDSRKFLFRSEWPLVLLQIFCPSTCINQVNYVNYVNPVNASKAPHQFCPPNPPNFFSLFTKFLILFHQISLLIHRIFAWPNITDSLGEFVLVETFERLLRDIWETLERLWRDFEETFERLLRDFWETFERLSRVCWETFERLLRVFSETFETLFRQRFRWLTDSQRVTWTAFAILVMFI